MQQQQHQNHQHQHPNYSDGSDGIGSPLDERDEGSVSAGGDPSDLFMAAAVAAAAAAAAANGEYIYMKSFIPSARVWAIDRGGATCITRGAWDRKQLPALKASVKRLGE